MGVLNRRLAELLVGPGQQSDLARKLGETRQRVNNWVRGISDVPADEVPNIAAALGLTICDLYGVEEGHTGTGKTTALLARIAEYLATDPERVEVNFYEGSFVAQTPVQPREEVDIIAYVDTLVIAAQAKGLDFTRRTIAEWPTMPDEERQEWRDLAAAIT